MLPKILNPLNPNDIEWDFIRSSGPGGQNVNKVATAVQLRFHIDNSISLSEEVKTRLKRIAANKINKQGELIIEAHKYRSQLQNRREAIERLIQLIQQAELKPRVRRHTRPGLAVRQRRLDAKRRQGDKKRDRGNFNLKNH